MTNTDDSLGGIHHADDDELRERLESILNNKDQMHIFVPFGYSKDYIHSKMIEGHGKLLSRIYRSIDATKNAFDYLEQERLATLDQFFSLHDTKFVQLVKADSDYQIKGSDESTLIMQVSDRVFKLVAHPSSLYSKVPGAFTQFLINHLLYSRLAANFNGNFVALLQLCYQEWKPVANEFYDAQVFEGADNLYGKDQLKAHISNIMYPATIDFIGFYIIRMIMQSTHEYALANPMVDDRGL